MKAESCGIGELPEVSEHVAERGRTSGRGRSRRGASRRGGRERSADETRIEIPAVVNGQILPGDADRIRFRGVRGQRLVAVVASL